MTDGNQSISFDAPAEYYADATRVSAGPYGFMFHFGLTSDSAAGDAQTAAIVRMSPQHALVMYQILKKHLREYEKQIGRIDLPDALFSDMGIEREV